MSAFDARGAEISAGDTVVYVSHGRYTQMIVGKIEKAEGSRAYFSQESEHPKEYQWSEVNEQHELISYNPEAPRNPKGKWVQGASCFKVYCLPYVEGRLNVAMGDVS